MLLCAVHVSIWQYFLHRQQRGLFKVEAMFFCFDLDACVFQLLYFFLFYPCLPHGILLSALGCSFFLFLFLNDVIESESFLLLFPCSLETTLRNYSCLTTGDSIMVAYNNKKYYIDIIESKPSNAISIIETDCEVDFAPPLDYKEPERPLASAAGKAPSQGNISH